MSSSLKSSAKALLEALGTDEAVHLALANAGSKYLAQLSEGIAKFHQHDHVRPAPAYEVLWREGSSELLALPGSHLKQPAILLIPSLINRAYIFDLSPETSAMRLLQEQGFRCLLLDWGAPADTEKGYGIGEYVLRLERALAALGEPVVLAGYCMGGMMAMAAAQHNPAKVKGLALLATPWDFHSADVPQLPGKEMYAQSFATFLQSSGTVPGELVYQLLYSANPWPVHDKFVRFAGMAPESPEAHAFVEREAWVQDGVDLTANAAKSCFIEWPVHNTPMKGEWKVAGEAIRPENISTPAFIAIARHDGIVPPACASVLSLKLPNAWTIYPPSGHVGMVAGNRAKEHLWLPLAKWAGSL